MATQIFHIRRASRHSAISAPYSPVGAGALPPGQIWTRGDVFFLFFFSSHTRAAGEPWSPPRRGTRPPPPPHLRRRRTAHCKASTRDASSRGSAPGQLRRDGWRPCLELTSCGRLLLARGLFSDGEGEGNRPASLSRLSVLPLFRPGP